MSNYPSTQAMRAAVELEIYNAIGRVQTVGIGELVQKVIDAERNRCIAVCEGWMERFEGTEIQYTSAREYACDAINDIIDLVRDGIDPTADVSAAKVTGE